MPRLPPLSSDPGAVRPLDLIDDQATMVQAPAGNQGEAGNSSGSVSISFAQPAPQPAPAPPPSAQGVAYRSIDGSGNNLRHSDMNVAGSDMTRIAPANFSDGLDTMVTGVNARDISNIVVAGNGSTPNAQGLSGMMYAWGQFIDHDLDMMKAGGASIDITTQANDPTFAGSSIALTRVVTDPNTGEGTGKAATAINSVTGWLDASMVYGSNATTEASLRLADGHMKTSSGNNLPIVDGMFVAGDSRVAENPDLTALQTLFVREHNYQVDLLKQQHPDWTGDHLFEQARAIVTAEIQHITYTEFLPHLLGTDAIHPYTGYRPNVNATITEEFAGAAYRFGHSIVSDEINSVSDNGAELSAQSLADVFFEPAAQFASTGDGADGLLRHLAGDVSNALDVHIVDDLRNFLFSPGEGQDLAAINIQRGRDLGLGTLNETRIALALTPYTSFSQLTHDSTTAQALSEAYGGDINSVDLWVGGLAEDAQPGAMVGQTFGTIIANQFEALRDGDRYWYQNQGFDQKTLAAINSTSLSDLILRDTDTQTMQADAFVYYDRHSGVVGGVQASDPNAPQLVVGADKGDILYGGTNNDILVAGSGNQQMTGNGGSDLFVLDNAVRTVAYITDFTHGQDQVEIENAGALSFRNVSLTRTAFGTVLVVGNEEIILAGVRPDELTASDFVFLR